MQKFLLTTVFVLSSFSAYAQNYKVGDVVTNSGISGGCPTFEGIVKLVKVYEQKGNFAQAAAENSCIKISPNVQLKVIDILGGDIIRIEHAHNSSENPLFVIAAGFSKLPEEQSQSQANDPKHFSLGIHVRQDRMFSFVQVTEVTPGGVADRVGIVRGDSIRSVSTDGENGVNYNGLGGSIPELSKAIEAASQTGEFRITLQSNAGQARTVIIDNPNASHQSVTQTAADDPNVPHNLNFLPPAYRNALSNKDSMAEKLLGLSNKSPAQSAAVDASCRGMIDTVKSIVQDMAQKNAYQVMDIVDAGAIKPGAYPKHDMEMTLENNLAIPDCSATVVTSEGEKTFFYGKKVIHNKSYVQGHFEQN